MMAEDEFDLDVIEDEIPKMMEQLEWVVQMLMKTKEGSPRRAYFLDRVRLFASEIGKLQTMREKFSFES